jgi:hypothetical protein
MATSGALPVKKQNFEISYHRRKQTENYENFPFGSGFAPCLEHTQQAAGYSASQNKMLPRE